VWHLIDLPTFFLPITLTLVVTLAIILAPVQPMRVQKRAGRMVRVSGAVMLWGALLAAGFWDAQQYSAYMPVYAAALRADDFRASAEQYQPFIAADPGLVVYRDQQAFLYGLAAHQGDPAARSAAIAGYEAVVQLEPYYAPDWANLGALYWADDQQRTGWEKMQRAAALRPADWNFQYSVGLYAEALGEDAAARAAYAQALQADPDADLHPAWGETALQRELHSELADRPPLTRVVLLMEAGQIDEALNLWTADPGEHRLVQYHVVRSLLALAQNAREEAQRWYESADKRRPYPDGDLWVTLNVGYLARYDGDRTALAAALETIEAYQAYQITTVDYRYGESISVNQFLRPAFPRQLLPPVFYSPEPVLLHYLRQQLQPDAN
jgi:tetratricopeptide (TPR) repeat protein